MIWKVKKSKLKGTITVPPSKSHTIRALLLATLADGESTIVSPLLEGDGHSALDAAEGLGAKHRISNESLKIKGIGTDYSLGSDRLFLGNSGTGARLFTSAAALGDRPRIFDGDESLRTRPMKPLLDALSNLGARYSSLHKSGDIPFTIKGPLTGGEIKVSGITSQFLSSLLIAAPLIPNKTTIHVENLHEKPYVEMTLWWLDKMNVKYDVSDNFSLFTVYGNQSYHSFQQRIPGDFSSATFGAVGAALTGGPVTLDNIDFSDPQGDKEVFTALENMGVTVKREQASASLRVDEKIKGLEIDLNKTPDALPAFSVLGCIAEGTTSIVNVRQARIKECDRIKVMTEELSKMGAKIEEKEDGLIVHQSKLNGFSVNGHNDHRVVMALALAGIVAEGETIIETAESAAVTYPTFVEDFVKAGANIESLE